MWLILYFRGWCCTSFLSRWPFLPTSHPRVLHGALRIVFRSGSRSPGPPNGSSWPLAQCLVTKWLLVTSQDDWEVSICSPGRGAHQSTVPEPAAPDDGPLSHRLGLASGMGTGSRLVLCARLQMEKQRRGPGGLLESTSLVSPFGKRVLEHLFSSLCPPRAQACSRRAFLPFHSPRPTEGKVSPRNTGTGL